MPRQFSLSFSSPPSLPLAVGFRIPPASRFEPVTNNAQQASNVLGVSESRIAMLALRSLVLLHFQISARPTLCLPNLLPQIRRGGRSHIPNSPANKQEEAVMGTSFPSFLDPNLGALLQSASPLNGGLVFH